MSRSGIIKLSDAEYFSDPSLSNSLSKHALKSSKHLEYAIKNPPKATPALNYGSLVHTLVLEPETFTEKFAINPGFSGKGAVAARNQWKEENKDKIIVSKDELDSAKAIAFKTSSDKILNPIIKNAQKEISCFSRCPTCFIPIKGKADLLGDDGFLYDVKTFSGELTDHAWLYQVRTFHYDMQAAWYLDLFSNFAPVNGFRFIAIEKNEPYEYRIFETSEEELEAGRIKYRHARIVYDLFKKFGAVGYDHRVNRLSQPKFYLQEIEGKYGYTEKETSFS